MVWLSHAAHGALLHQPHMFPSISTPDMTPERDSMEVRHVGLSVIALQGDLLSRAAQCSYVNT